MNPSIEERLAALEKSVAELQKTVRPSQNKKGWLDRFRASFQNDPTFDEIVRLGQEMRLADRPVEGTES